ADLADAAPHPLLQQRAAGEPVAVEAGRLVADRRPLEPGAFAVQVLDVGGDRAGRQAAAGFRLDPRRQARTAGLVEQSGAGLPARTVAVRQAPVVAGAGRRQRARRGNGVGPGTRIGPGGLAAAAAGQRRASVGHRIAILGACTLLARSGGGGGAAGVRALAVVAAIL